MKKLFVSLLCMTMLLGGCSKIEEVKKKTAKQVYEAALQSFKENVNTFNLELTIDGDYYQLDGNVMCDSKQQLQLIESDLNLGKLKMGHGYVLIQEAKTDFMFATPITRYHSGKIDNEMIEKVVSIFQENDSPDLYSLEGFDVTSIEFDEQKNVITHLAKQDNELDYVVTMNIKDSMFTTGKIEIVDKEKVVSTIHYSFKDINQKLDLQQKWQEVLQLEGSSM